MPYPRQVAYVVQREHAESPVWLAEQAWKYGIAIINSSTVTAAMVAAVKKALAPPQLVLVAENTLDGMAMVHNGVQDIRRRPIVEQGLVPGWITGTTAGGIDIPGYVLRPPMAEPLADVDILRVKELLANGLYVDQCFPRYPNWVRAQILAAKGGDAAAAQFVSEAAEDFTEARMLFSRRIRTAGLSTWTLIVNCHNRNYDPSPTGISLESVPDPLTGLDALIRAPYQTGANIVWENSAPASLAFLSQLPFVHIGINIPPP